MRPSSSYIAMCTRLWPRPTSNGSTRRWPGASTVASWNGSTASSTRVSCTGGTNEVQLDRLEFLGLDVALSGSDRAEVTASWEVGGRLRHRGHVHLRLLRHRARSTLQFVPPEGWRLVACEVLQGQDFTLSEAERERGTAPPVAATVAPEPRPGP